MYGSSWVHKEMRGYVETRVKIIVGVTLLSENSRIKRLLTDHRLGILYSLQSRPPTLDLFGRDN
jgi:hypothetical protein